MGINSASASGLPAKLCTVLTCEECRCVSESGKGWFGQIAEDPEDGEGPVVCTYCPPCAERVLDARTRVTHYV